MVRSKTESCDVPKQICITELPQLTDPHVTSTVYFEFISLIENMMMCGGTDEPRNADEEIQKICDEVGGEIWTLLHLGFSFLSGVDLCFSKIHCHLFHTQMKSHTEAKTGKSYEVFTAKTCTSQVVAGTNYFIKVKQGRQIWVTPWTWICGCLIFPVFSLQVHVGGDEHVHLRVLRKLPCNGGGLELHNVQEGKSLSDPIGHFWCDRTSTVWYHHPDALLFFILNLLYPKQKWYLLLSFPWSSIW